MFFFVWLVGWHKNKVFGKYISRKRWRHCSLSPTMWTCGHYKSIYFNILTRCMSEWCFSLLSWNLKVVSLYYCVTSQLRLCAPISTTENIYLSYCVLCICDIYVFCICEYFNKHSFVTSDPLLMLLSVQQFQAEKWWFDEKPQGHASGNTNTKSNTNPNIIAIILILMLLVILILLILLMLILILILLLILMLILSLILRPIISSGKVVIWWETSRPCAQ